MDGNEKVFVVSGANAGLGLETSRQIVDAGHTVVMLCRTPEKCSFAQEEVKRTHPNAKVLGIACDMSIMQQIRDAAAKIVSQFEVVDGVVNNVGTWKSQYSLTSERIETVFATNHLSYVMLTHCLYPALKKSADARVVNVSSNAHSYGKINLSDPGYSKNYHGLKSNGQSKLANVYFTEAFHEHKPDDNIHTYAVSPGLVKTDIGLKHTSWLHSLAWKFRRRKGQTPAEGARTSVFCALDPSVEGRSGLFWENCAPKETFKSAKDPKVREALWKLSNEMIGIEDYFFENVSV